MHTSLRSDFIVSMFVIFKGQLNIVLHKILSYDYYPHFTAIFLVPHRTRPQITGTVMNLNAISAQHS